MTKDYTITLEVIEDARKRLRLALNEYENASWALNTLLERYEPLADATHDHDWHRPDAGGALQCSTCNADYNEEGDSES